MVKISPPEAKNQRSLDGCGPLGHLIAMMIYKIFRSDEWQHLRQQGQTLGAPIDLQDGYIHFSTAAQAAETAARHFAGQTDLMLAAVAPDGLGADLKWEISRGGAAFPHLYRALHLTDVVWCQPLPLVAGQHQFPAGLE